MSARVTGEWEGSMGELLQALMIGFPMHRPAVAELAAGVDGPDSGAWLRYCAERESMPWLGAFRIQARVAAHEEKAPGEFVIVVILRHQRAKSHR